MRLMCCLRGYTRAAMKTWLKGVDKQSKMNKSLYVSIDFRLLTPGVWHFWVKQTQNMMTQCLFQIVSVWNNVVNMMSHGPSQQAYLAFFYSPFWEFLFVRRNVFLNFHPATSILKIPPNFRDPLVFGCCLRGDQQVHSSLTVYLQNYLTFIP